MFRHQGKTRTLSHNLRIASLLSFVAGMVNVTGFLAVGKLTTNVTGHFAFFVDEVFRFKFWEGVIYFIYILCFLAGSFTSSFLIEIISEKSDKYIYTIPASIEVFILIIIGLGGNHLMMHRGDFIACSLLFAMGLQNSLVTRISNAMVRTTHLTGHFTDLGIELAQLLFYKQPQQYKHLLSSIRLRCTIIVFFFSGGVLSGLFFNTLSFYVLIIGACILAGGITYDAIKMRILIFKRKGKQATGAGNV